MICLMVLKLFMQLNSIILILDALLLKNNKLKEVIMFFNIYLRMFNGLLRLAILLVLLTGKLNNQSGVERLLELLISTID